MSFLHLLPVILLAVASYSNAGKCFTREVYQIPPDHLFSRLKKPVVIGHRGNPRFYQENTLDGFKSLLELNVDGFELDIYLTKDKKLVAFHDDNTQFLTGENHTIFDMNYSEIQKLDVKDQLDFKYGTTTKVWKYDKKRKIPLLEDILTALKDSNLLMYLEMKPGHNPTDDMQLSIDTGKEVAKLVTKLGLEKKTMINSFDPFQTLAVKQENPELIVGTFFRKGTFVNSDKIKSKLNSSLPGMDTCSNALPSGEAYTRYILEFGTVLKAINGSFVDMWYKFYDNPTYTNDTFSKIKKNYGSGVTFGGWTIYSMQETQEEWDAAEDQIDTLISNGGARLITDNIPKVLKKLGRPLKRSSTNSVPGTSMSVWFLVISIIPAFLNM